MKMKKITFKCTLLSDIIINRKSATVGNQLTLDFIPGNNFYGIVANKLYNDSSVSDEVRYDVLHSGKVRFGDAHPSRGNDRAVHVPAAMFYPKLAGIENTYINHAINRESVDQAKLNDLQLKQCRTGFYIFKNKQGEPVEVAKTFSLKSAYDRDKRRAKDSQMFGYESINKGLELIFEVYIDEDITTNIVDLLVGTQRVGRSRTAQYGLVEIRKLAETDVTNNPEIKEGDEFYVYADSRLILKDEYGNASADARYMFNSDECELILAKTQVRLFQYSPWNYKRQSHDTDRYGIEKGSVIAFKAKKAFTPSHFVGLYQAEGFGHILINPDFLDFVEINGSAPQPNALYKLQKANAADSTKNETTAAQGNENNYKLELINTSTLNGFAKNLAFKANDERCKQHIYVKVSEFVNLYQKAFTTDRATFASQWGHIRNIATKCSKCQELIDKLFYDANANTNANANNDAENGYLLHGQASQKWAARVTINKEIYIRKDLLRDFIDQMHQVFSNQVYSDRYIPMAVVNLASEMAKVCKPKK
jgi:hypothetical protein